MANLCYAFSNENICVNTGEVLCKKNKSLATSFINTCCALGFHVNGYNYLAHIDDMNLNMYNMMVYVLNDNNINIQDIKKINIWVGRMCGDNCKSLKIAKQFVSYLNRPVSYYKDNDELIVIDVNII